MVENTASLSIVTPCYNPSSSWAANYLQSCKSIEKLLNITDIEWILVNDGSTSTINQEDIAMLSKEIKGFAYYSYSENKGKGYAVRYGAKKATAPKLIFTDIDFPYLNDNIKSVYELISEQNDIVIGKRAADYYKNISKNRAWISKKFKQIIAFLFKIPTTDTQAGIKGFNKKGKEILLKTSINRYLFDLEMVKLATKEKLHIVETQVELKPNVIMPNMKTTILLSEILNLIKILFK